MWCTEDKIQNLEWAYELKYNPEMSFKNFKDIYSSDKEIEYNISNRKFNFIWNDTFNFYVHSFEEWNNPEKYKTTIKVIDWKLQTINVEKIDKEILEEVIFWNNKWIIEWEKWDLYVYLEQDWIKKKIFTEKSNEFSTFYFSAYIYWLEFLDNDILVFHKSWWEFHEMKFYNIRSWKLIEWSSDIYWITDNNKYLYFCWVWMWGWDIKIYNKNDFTLFKDLDKEDKITRCIEYKNNVLKYELYEWWDNYSEKEYTF
jgi:hypothetical protein